MQFQKNKKINIPALNLAHAELIYDATRELLVGSIEKFHINERVYSGGSRGHTMLPKSRATETAKRAKDYHYNESLQLTSRLANTATKEKKLKSGRTEFIQRGGTLPPGIYTCKYTFNKNLGGECIFLDRPAGEAGRMIYSPFSPHPIPHNRTNEFFIHKFGPKGSDGCLVFPQNAELKRLKLNQAIKNFHGIVTVRVINVSYMLPAEIGGQLAKINNRSMITFNA